MKILAEVGRTVQYYRYAADTNPRAAIITDVYAGNGGLVNLCVFNQDGTVSGGYLCVALVQPDAQPPPSSTPEDGRGEHCRWPESVVAAALLSAASSRYFELAAASSYEPSKHAVPGLVKGICGNDPVAK